MAGVFLILTSIIIYYFDSLGILSVPKGLFERFFNNFGRVVFTQNTATLRLREENIELLAKIKNQRELELENNALRVQLAHPPKASQKILLSKVLSGDTSFLIIDKGSQDNVSPRQTVIYKNILVGKIVSVSTNRARVELPTSQNSKLPAKTQRQAQGILLGQGGTMLLDNVTLSESLEAKDLVFTTRGSDVKEGVLPDFLIGEITRVYKNESALFQQGTVKSPLDWSSQEFVFIVL